MATEKLYLKDMYARRTEATVTAVEQNKVILDRTIFYAESGGQLGDTGSIELLKVCDTQKKITRETVMLTDPDFPSINVNTDVVHILEEDSAQLTVGQKVQLVIDWERRYSTMKLHSAAHVVWYFVEQSIGDLPIKGCLIGADKARLDFGKKIDPDAVPALIQKSNDFIAANHPIENVCLSNQTEALYWICDRIKMPCGGTHVKNTSEIGPIHLKRRSQGKMLDRLYITFEG